jgi:transcription-repair coupling factor
MSSPNISQSVISSFLQSVIPGLIGNLKLNNQQNINLDQALIPYYLLSEEFSSSVVICKNSYIARILAVQMQELIELGIGAKGRVEYFDYDIDNPEKVIKTNSILGPSASSSSFRDASPSERGTIGDAAISGCSAPTGFDLLFISLDDYNSEIALDTDCNQQVALDSERDTVLESLGKYGYNRVDIVEQVGDFSVRGEIIDVYLPYEDYPIRLDYFGDTVETIRYFRVEDQISFEPVSKQKFIYDLGKNDLQQVKVKDQLKGLDIAAIDLEFSSFSSGVAEKSLDPSPVLRTQASLRPEVPVLKHFPTSSESLENSLVTISTFNSQVPVTHFEIFETQDKYEATVANLKYEGYQILEIEEESILPSWSSEQLKVGVFNKSQLLGNRFSKQIVTGKVLGDKVTKRKNQLDLLDLKVGDFLVHDVHGIGQFDGLRIENSVDGNREYIVLKYAESKKGFGADEVLIPADQLNSLTKYHSHSVPRLSKIGSLAWQTTKKAVQKQLNKVARELMQLYSKRAIAKGYQYAAITEFDKDLASSFDFELTKDQETAINDVFEDMASPTPMDRLVIGDVGFGKTEVAIRAAFKAVQAKKQVTVLVPSTVLAMQHLESFKYRLNKFGVRLAMMSSFNTGKEREQILQQLESGELDIVIGTHALFNPKIKFKDLGLIIIDEEQRFGVEHKETLKALKTSVDILSLSATPIPRTLELSLSSIRQMSTIMTPPLNRMPIETIVTKYNNDQVVEAIEREINRYGQVFYLFNNVAKLPDRIAKLKSLLGPSIVIEGVHAKMTPNQIDDVFTRFYQGLIDVLVTTTIIENGLDVENANTLIVEDAHKFGIADLYQLRGRVGRSANQAYAYLTYPNSNITELAFERLKTLSENNALGSGLNIAMKDLELRGAGNLIGFEQSGMVRGVGFDLYIKMLADTIERFKNPDKYANELTLVELKVESNIPVDYISNVELRLEMYNKLSSAIAPDSVAAVKAEMIDRYGKLPEPVENLFQVIDIRNTATELGIRTINNYEGNISFTNYPNIDVESYKLSNCSVSYRPVPKILELKIESNKENDILLIVKKFVNIKEY